MTASRFGFRAKFTPVAYDGDNAGWQVTLPEQYDEWTITAPSYYDPPVSHAEAVAALGRFVAEAQSLLAELQAAPEVPEGKLSLTPDGEAEE